MKFEIKDLTIISLLVAVAIILNLIEVAFIPSIIPGAKVGFANIVTVAAIFLLSFKHVVMIVLLRTTVAALLIGSFLGPGHILSLAGGLASVLVVYSIYSLKPSASPIFLCIIGAITHNLAQLAMAYLLIGYGFIYLLPYLILFAVPAGFITGKLVDALLKSKHFSKGGVAFE